VQLKLIDQLYLCNISRGNRKRHYNITLICFTLSVRSDRDSYRNYGHLHISLEKANILIGLVVTFSVFFPSQQHIEKSFKAMHFPCDFEKSRREILQVAHCSQIRNTTF
jgi:hypothetical protein